MTLEELSEYGIERMDDTEIQQFLATHHVGILGLPTGESSLPLMRPLSYWFDGSSRLCFNYVLAAASRKDEGSQHADVGRFLVYSVETPFSWRSVLVDGPISKVPAQDAVRDEMVLDRRPDVFEQIDDGETTTVYQLRIDDQIGIKNSGLPPGFEEDRAEE